MDFLMDLADGELMVAHMEAKPTTACPFCAAGADHLDVEELTHVVAFAVVCNGCGCEGPSALTAIEAVDRWEARADADDEPAYDGSYQDEDAALNRDFVRAEARALGGVW
jgi:predicted dithiol-disulfide oxidoreductase (DUF899 family)